MKLVNVTIPKRLNREIIKVARKRYTSVGEYVRSSILKLLTKQSILPHAAKVNLLRKLVMERMQKRGEKFDPEKEMIELKKIREGIYNARGS